MGNKLEEELIGVLNKYNIDLQTKIYIVKSILLQLQLLYQDLLKQSSDEKE